MADKICYTVRVLKELFGTETTEKILLQIFHNGEAHASAISQDQGISRPAVQNKLDKLEQGGFLVSVQRGRTRSYMLNPKSPYYKPLMEMLRVAHESIPLKERQKMFARRTRPRARGKTLK
jgi:predicted transcriptional regulator